MKFHAKQCSWWPAMWDALTNVRGDVLDLGTGVHSTMALHWICQHQKRRLVSFEHNPKYIRMVTHCQSDRHDIVLVEDWDDAIIERDWGIALVDHGPPERRKVEVTRLADWARVIICHDAQNGQRHHYHYEEVLPSFKYRKDYRSGKRLTVMVSNRVDVAQW